MRIPLKSLLLACTLFVAPASSFAQDFTLDTFEIQPETRWRFFADTVMGGVSTGQVSFLAQDGARFARLTGDVSTANNGGFIQMRMDLPDAAPPDATGVRLVVRGNDQRYFVHLRTAGMVVPWQYYQAGFDVTGAWREVRLPFSDFEASGRLMRTLPRSDRLTSIGLVAYGRDHSALLDIREVGFY